MEQLFEKERIYLYGKCRCNECGAIFSNDLLIKKEYQESREFWGASCYETFTEYFTPCCGSDDFEDTVYVDEDEDYEEVF